MPAHRSRACFEPLPPDLDVRTLVESTPNFHYVDRISYDRIQEHGQEKFDQLILLHVVIKGKPLVIDGFGDRLDSSIFSPEWLTANHGDKGTLRLLCSLIAPHFCFFFSPVCALPWLSPSLTYCVDIS